MKENSGFTEPLPPKQVGGGGRSEKQWLNSQLQEFLVQHFRTAVGSAKSEMKNCWLSLNFRPPGSPAALHTLRALCAKKPPCPLTQGLALMFVAPACSVLLFFPCAGLSYRRPNVITLLEKGRAPWMVEPVRRRRGLGE